MASSADTKDESPYYRFTKNPNAECESQGREADCPVPMMMLHTDGSILYENVHFDLLYTIIAENDTNTLQKYLVIAPWAVSMETVFTNDLWAVPDRYLFTDYASDVVLDMDPCMWATCKGSLGVFKILLNHCTKGKDSDMEIRGFDSGGLLLLNEAARHGHVDIVRFLLNNQPRYSRIDERDANDCTALLSAAAARYIDRSTSLREELEAIISLLLDQGASASDVSYWDEELRNTVLTSAAEWAGSQLIKRLIDDGADIYTKVVRGRWEDKLWNLPEGSFEVNALYVACTHANFEAVKSLIDCRGAEVEMLDVIWQRDTLGSLPLHWVNQTCLPKESFGYSKEAVYDKARSITDIIELLLDLDPTIINVSDKDGNTPLHYATRSPSRYDKMYTPIIQLLCARGADASIQNTESQTPLHTLFRLEDGDEYRDYICKKSSVDPVTVLTLLAHGASPADIDMAGDTPLHIAAANLEWADVVSLLLVHGADPALPNLKGQTALHRAAGGTYLGRNKDYQAPERIRAQEDVFSRLVKAGGVELMDLTDAEGMKPGEISNRTRKAWKELDGPPKQTGNGSGRERGPRMHKI
ncbi:ankyrin [Fusarium fujikuroi]|nr:ankyrin [Fusarium fujikuroi]